MSDDIETERMSREDILASMSRDEGAKSISASQALESTDDAEQRQTLKFQDVLEAVPTRKSSRREVAHLISMSDPELVQNTDLEPSQTPPQSTSPPQTLDERTGAFMAHDLEMSSMRDEHRTPAQPIRAPRHPIHTPEPRPVPKQHALLNLEVRGVGVLLLLTLIVALMATVVGLVVTQVS